MEMEINLNEFFKYLASKAVYIILLVVLFVIAGVIYINFILTPMYRSSTTLILVSNDNTNNSTLLQSEVNLNKNLVTTYSEIVKSRTVLKNVIEQLDLDMTVAELSNSITVNSVENTEIIKIEVSNESNKTAKDIAATTAESFKKEVERIYNLTNVSIVDEAYLATNAYNVSPIKQIVLFTVAGLVVGVGIVFLVFYFDTSIKSSEDIEEKIGLSVIGNVTLVNNNTKKG